MPATSRARMTERVGLVELHREAVGEVIEDIFPRRDIDAHVVPFLGREFCEAPLHQRLASGDDLHHGGMTGVEVRRD